MDNKKYTREKESTEHQTKSTPDEKDENVDGSTISNESTNLTSFEENQQEEILNPEVTAEYLKKLFQQTSIPDSKRKELLTDVELSIIETNTGK